MRSVLLPDYGRPCRESWSRLENFTHSSPFAPSSAGLKSGVNRNNKFSFGNFSSRNTSCKKTGESLSGWSYVGDETEDAVDSSSDIEGLSADTTLTVPSDY